MSGSASATVRIDARELVRNLLLLCIACELLFFNLDYHFNYANPDGTGAVRRLFNTANESSLPSWFSIMQTAMVAVTVWLIFIVVRGATESRWRRIGWLALALFFTYLAFDDGAHIHERLGTAYEEMFAGAAAGSSLAAWSLDVFPSYRWQIVFMPLFGLMGMFMFVFLLRELRSTRAKVTVFVALACLAAAVGIDFFEGLSRDHPLNPYTAIASTWHLDYWAARNFDRSAYDTLVHFSKSIEECVEMFGMSLLWVTFLSHFAWLSRDLRVVFTGVGTAEERRRRDVASGMIATDSSLRPAHLADETATA